jgi:thioredoxin 1
MSVPTTINDSNFANEVLASEKPVLVDFWADWCGPCKMISPIISDIAHEKSDILKVAKLNIDDNLQSAQKYQVLSIPTLIVFKNGSPIKRIVGALSKTALLKELSSLGL